MSTIRVTFWEEHYVNDVLVGRTEQTVQLHERNVFEFPLNIRRNSGTPPETNSIVRRLVQEMNQETFPSLNVGNRELARGRGFVSGHLVSQAYGGRGNDENMVPMTRSLNTLYHNRLEALIKAMRREFPGSSAKVRMEIRLYFAKIMSESGESFVHVEKIRVNVSLVDATRRERRRFDRDFRDNPDYRDRTTSDRVTIQFSNDALAEVMHDVFSSETVEEPSTEGDSCTFQYIVYK